MNIWLAFEDASTDPRTIRASMEASTVRLEAVQSTYRSVNVGRFCERYWFDSSTQSTVKVDQNQEHVMPKSVVRLQPT